MITAVLLTMGASSNAAYSEVPQLAFSERSSAGDSSVFISDLAGDRVKVLATSGSYPTISPDGNSVAFVRSGRLQLANTQTGAIQELFAPGSNCPPPLLPVSDSVGVLNPQYSPDGSELVFYYCSAIWSIQASGGAPECRVSVSDIAATPAISPNGRKIAYSLRVFGDHARSGLYERDMASGCLDKNPGRLIVSEQQLEADDADPDLDSPPGTPTYSPDGEQIAFNTAHSCTCGVLAIINRDGSGLRYPQDSRSPFGPINELTQTLGYGALLNAGTEGFSPKFSPDSTRLYMISAYTSDRLSPTGTCGTPPCRLGVFSINLDGSDLRFIGGTSYEGSDGTPWRNEMRVSVANLGGLAQELAVAQKYAPVLRYSSGEKFFFDSAASITDAADAALIDELARPLANHDGSGLLGSGPLSLETLETSPYLTTYNSVAQSQHALDEENSSREFTASAFHASAAYGDKSYARVYHVLSGETFVQYLYFAYYNDGHLPAGFGNHEADWEMMQVHLAANGSPLRATFGTHHEPDAMTCEWNQTLAASGTHPLAYVAFGSHGLYPAPGLYPTESTVAGVGEFDVADGQGAAAAPPASLIDGAYGSWAAWPGEWGGDARGTAPHYEIRGPAAQGLRWDDPQAYEDQARDCLVSGRRSPARNRSAGTGDFLEGVGPRPARVRVHAARVGSKVLIRLSLARHAKVRRPRLVRVSLVDAGPIGPRVRWTKGLRKPRSWRRLLLVETPKLAARVAVQVVAVSRTGRLGQPVTVKARRAARLPTTLRPLVLRVPRPVGGVLLPIVNAPTGP